MTTDQPAAPTQEHPSWCVRTYCTANQGRSGAHRSAPIIASETPLRITANLYASAASPDVELVELRGISVLLPASAANGLGRVLVSMGKVVGQ